MLSSPIRGTWIEIRRRWWMRASGETVVPHTGDVDRNYAQAGQPRPALRVVPHTGDVDRNLLVYLHLPGRRVVPHTGDVDRNVYAGILLPLLRLSSPIRGTWIEMALSDCLPSSTAVVPHTGDVDRNQMVKDQNSTRRRRPPYGGRG